MMSANRLKRIRASGCAAVHGWPAAPSGFAAETMAHQGRDSLTVDLRRGMVGGPWLDPAHRTKGRDAGACGVICPAVNAREDAARLVARTRYPPLGGRSLCPIHGLPYGGADYPEQANDTVVVLAMIETREGPDNLDDIVSTPGLDAVCVGPSDLSLARGRRPTFDDVDAPGAEAIAFTAASAKEHGEICGIHNGAAETAPRRIGMGYRFVAFSSDTRLMASGRRRSRRQCARRNVREGHPAADRPQNGRTP